MLYVPSGAVLVKYRKAFPKYRVSERFVTEVLASRKIVCHVCSPSAETSIEETRLEIEAELVSQVQTLVRPTLKPSTELVTTSEKVRVMRSVPEKSIIPFVLRSRAVYSTWPRALYCETVNTPSGSRCLINCPCALK